MKNSELYTLVKQLSKSSPQAVFTPKELTDSDPSTIFDYLYLPIPIEIDYRKLLGRHLNSKVIIFLCGSSGDGKSAIIGQNQRYFFKHYNVHIDATHSFRPTQSAIEALDERFTQFYQSDKSLVVGINIGILLNFAREGSDSHQNIKKAIEQYMRYGNSTNECYFINFEDYSKFEMNQDKITSSFIRNLLDKVTDAHDSNPFYQAFEKDRANNITTKLHQNYQLLSHESIKNSIVELLVTVHLKYDQFLTTRNILDFIYTILNGDNLLINALFEDKSNTIIENICKEDPCLLRTEKLDTFILERKSNQEDLALQEFLDEFNAQCQKPILLEDNPHLLIRIFYLFRDQEYSNNYHQIFNKEFEDTTTYEFIRLLYAHNNGDTDAIYDFYESLENAILAYANKRHPSLSDEGLMTLSEVNGYALCADVEFDPNWEELTKDKQHQLRSFGCALMVNKKAL
ncbi:MAG: DNA phosphorothioation-dependent restriction protein DptF, partial [Campylobacterota bacterium]|nr:DNA phosphorothioation-dependent restriction protein DptF [Campylobacterota bacterium]